MNENDIRNGYRQHGALAQLYRWWQWYEHPDSPLVNQLDIMTSDIRIDAPSGLVESRDAYAEVAAGFPVMQNAHIPESIELTMGDGEISGTADITYLNIGAQPDGALTAMKIHYELGLKEQGSTPLPLFNSIAITMPGAAEGESEFRDAYAVSRSRSLVHYYLALLEDPNRTLEPFGEIFAEDVSLSFGPEPLTGLDDFSGFLERSAATVVASNHVITDFAAADNGDNTLTATIDFDWFGILPDGGQMTAATRHTWLINDDPTARFAKIQRADVEHIRPFVRTDS